MWNFSDVLNFDLISGWSPPDPPPPLAIPLSGLRVHPYVL